MLLDVDATGGMAGKIYLKSYLYGVTANLPADAANWGWFIQLPKSTSGGDFLQVLIPFRADIRPGNPQLVSWILIRTRDGIESFSGIPWLKIQGSFV